MMNTSPSPVLKPEKPMTFVAPSWTASHQSDTLLPQDADRFGHSRFGTSPDEDVVIDERSQLSPSQAVENRLVALLRESSVPVSHLQIRGFVRGRFEE